MFQKQYFKYTKMERLKQPLGGHSPLPPRGDGTAFHALGYFSYVCYSKNSEKCYYMLQK